ncbi:MAG: hypothetical protein ACK5T6_07630, partial [Pirellula sp.]
MTPAKANESCTSKDRERGEAFDTSIKFRVIQKRLLPTVCALSKNNNPDLAETSNAKNESRIL